MAKRITGRRVLYALGFAVLVFGLMQLVPYRYDNPPVIQEPPWDSERTRELARAACFDCHSNETDPYWFEELAPVSWLVAKDVDEGRDKLNFSECTPDEGGGDGDDAADEVLEGSMPPDLYTLFGILHPAAQLSDAERQELARGLLVTLANVDCDDG